MAQSRRVPGNATIGIPIVLSLVAFVLSALALFAGKSPNFMEDYDLVRLNTSELGKNLVPTPTMGNPASNCPTILGFDTGKACSAVESAVGSAATAVASELSSIGDDIADKLSAKLGIAQFYSLHALDLCQGNFTPNATAPGAGYNVTNCTTPLDTSEFNVSAKIDRDLSIGPLHINLAQLGVTQELQDDLNDIPGLLKALAAIFIVAFGLTGLAFIDSIAGLLVLPAHAAPMVLSNFILAGLSALFLLIGALVMQVGVKKAVDKINQVGGRIGMTAVFGSKFAAIVWAAFALMAAASIFWLWDALRRWRSRGSRRGAHGHHHKRTSDDSERGMAQVRRG